jgi:outer membrane protein assembly factor BamB
MKTFLACLVLGLAATAPAAGATSEPADCKTYLVGNWIGGAQTTAGTTRWQASLAATGRFIWVNTAQAAADPTPVTEQLSGSWTAGTGGAARTCVLLLSPQSGNGWSETLTITGPDTMTDGRGNPVQRVK